MGGINPYTQFNLALTVPVGSSASEVAGKLRLTNFTEALQLSTHAELDISNVFVEPTAFVTTTTTSTATIQQPTTPTIKALTTTKFLLVSSTSEPLSSSTPQAVALSGGETLRVRSNVMLLLCGVTV